MPNDVITICKHVAGGQPFSHLLGHQGETLAAFCPECEELVRLSNGTEPGHGFLHPASEERTIPFVRALELGIPEHVGDFDDECCVYCRAN
jgi:hypothetical protein